MPVDLQLDLSLRIMIAAVLSAIVGYNRQRHEHPAGLRTHILVGMGSALFTVLSIYAFGSETGRVAAQIVTGIGFLGAGAIVQQRQARHVHGMTTAAGIWAVSAVGMAAGAGFYLLAGVSAILIWGVLEIVGWIEKKTMPESDRPGEPISPAGPPKENSPQERRDRSA